MLLRSKVSRCNQLLYRVGYKCKRSTQVVRNVGKEHQLRLRGDKQLFVQRFFCISLRFELTILLLKLGLVFLSLPKSVKQEE